MVYHENNQLTEAVICDGKSTRKVQYTYDADGNLIQEYSPTDRNLTTYSYTVENRLEAVCTGNAYNRTLQMAAAYDGDGNRIYQLNYNPDKDEDFSDYYCSYQNCDYNGTGIQLLAEKEISQAEKDLIALVGASGAVRNSQYELIEYINDVNREYAEVLIEQNINGRIDTVYTYGNVRISREMFSQTSRTAYYLYDPRGSVSGLTDQTGHLTKTYRYSANGELTFGGATYENEYTYNGESYNPNIQSQYLRARYYSVVHASFLTEDSYLGNIVQPLTLNRYNYCVSSWLNYRDPSGNNANGYPGIDPTSAMDIWYLLTGDEEYREQAQEYREQQMELDYYEASTTAGMWDALVSHVGSIGVLIANACILWGNAETESQIRQHNLYYGERYGYAEFKPLPMIPADTVDNYLEEQASKVWDMDCYYAGRCGGDVILMVAEAVMIAKGLVGAFGAGCNAFRNVAASSEIIHHGGVLCTADGWTESYAAYIDLEALGVAVAEAVKEGVAEGTVVAAPATFGFHTLNDFKTNYSKINMDRLLGNEGGSKSKIGDFTNLEGSTVDDILDRIPDEATLRELYPVEGGATEGFEFKWVQDGQTYRVRVHNADPGAPAGSNAANGWVLRIQRGTQYYDYTINEFQPARFQILRVHFLMRVL